MGKDLRERNTSNLPVDKQAHLAERAFSEGSAAREVAQEFVSRVEVLDVTEH